MSCLGAVVVVAVVLIMSSTAWYKRNSFMVLLKQPPRLHEKKSVKSLPLYKQKYHRNHATVHHRILNAKGVYVWRHFGVAPYATSRATAIRTRMYAFARLGLPLPVAKLFVTATKRHGSATLLTNGDHLSKMISRGGVVHRNVLVEFTTPKAKGKMEYAAPAEKWKVIWKGRTYVLILPRVCNNWSVIIPNVDQCYSIPLNYSHTPDVAWGLNHTARVEFHFAGMSSRTREQLDRSTCFRVVDKTGRHVPFHRCKVCESSGGQWPQPALATAVGLPEKEPSGIFTAPLADGVGYMSLPKWAVAYLGVYCVDTKPYPVSIRNFTGWTAVTRFDLVSTYEMSRSVRSGRLSRVLSGKKHY